MDVLFAVAQGAARPTTDPSHSRARRHTWTHTRETRIIRASTLEEGAFAEVRESAGRARGGILLVREWNDKKHERVRAAGGAIFV